MELTAQVKSNLKQLKYDIHPVTTGELVDFAPQLGYESMGWGTTYADQTEGVLIRLPEGKNKYNNGVYMLHRLKTQALVMEVIDPNTRDKGDLIQTFVDAMTTHLDGLDTSDLQIYDYIDIYGLVIANTVLKPTAKRLFPTDKIKQEKFLDLYMPRFLSNMAHLYIGDDKLFEEGVNSEPYVVKQMIDNTTAQSKKDKETANVQSKSDNVESKKDNETANKQSKSDNVDEE